MSVHDQPTDRAARLREAIEARKAAARAGHSGIASRDPLEAARLGDLQRGLWVVHQVDPQSPAYNLCSAFRIAGSVDFSRLQRALDVVVARHRLLRSTFRTEGDTVFQIVHDALPVAIERIEAGEHRGLEEAARHAARPFDLERGPLVRASVVEEAAGRQYLTLAVHHILADEQSLRIIWGEVAAAYAGRLDNGAPAIQYDDYVQWATRTEASRRDEDLGYWRRRLSTLPEELRLPFERQGPERDGPGRLLQGAASRSLAAGVRRLAAACGATPFIVGAFAFRLLLHRYTHGQPVAFGTPVSMRAHPATAEMIGYFLNTVVISGSSLDEQETVGAAVERFSRDVRDVLAHASVPFDTLAAQLSPRRYRGRHPIFQVMFVYQAEGEPPVLENARLEPVALDLGGTKFDVTLFLTERAGSLQTAVEFRADRFDAVWMQRLLDHYGVLLEQLPLDHARRVADVPLLGAEERSRLADWERGPRLVLPPVLMPALIAEQVCRHPGHTAVACGAAQADYEMLDRGARRVAGALLQAGVRPADRVALFLERSVPMIEGIIAVHHAGAAYVPLDPAHPHARIADLLADADVSAVLTTSVLRGRLPAGPWQVLDVDTLERTAECSTVAGTLAPDSPAYILYTSGSTGRPKGVVVTHDNLRASTLARMQAYDAPPARFLLLPSLTFDSSVAGIFWSLASGGTLIVPTDAEATDVRSLARLVRERDATTLLCVPSLYAELLGSAVAALQNVDTVIVAGEICPPRLVADHFSALPHVRLYNEYGPTEATVWATVHEISREDAGHAVPIGRPIPGVCVQVLDALGRRVPAGIPGDGWIEGPTVAAGYWRRDDLTVERFVHTDPVDGTRRYRTGDRLAWTDRGRLLFHGRDDEQLKLRGYRIEPGEIEAALLEHPSIAHAAVVARPLASGPARLDDAATLVAFVVARQPGRVHGWRESLAARVPVHLIPARLVEVPELPRLPNGKIDRRELRERSLPADGRAKPAPAPDLREQALISLWEGLLGRYGIGPTDNLFELGGHSLLVIQMVAAIARDFEVSLTAADVFERPTVRELARRIAERAVTGARPYDQLFPIQPAGRKTPFIMAVPDFFTEALAAAFRGDRPVYGVRGIGLRAEGNRGRWRTLEHLAMDVAAEIQRRFPEGAYILAGYSFGAWLAIETARVMEQRGRPARELYVIAPMPVDFYRAGPFRVRIDGLQGSLERLSGPETLRLWVRANHPLTQAPYRRARQWLAERPWRRLLAAIGGLRRRAGLSLTPRLLQADVRVERFRLHAGYRPGRVQTRTIFFNPAGTATDAAATWRPYFGGPFTVHPIPDPHDEASVDAARQVVMQHLAGMKD